MDEFTNPKTGRKSKMFRVTWRDMSKTLTNEYVNAKHQIVLDRIVVIIVIDMIIIVIIMISSSSSSSMFSCIH